MAYAKHYSAYLVLALSSCSWLAILRLHQAAYRTLNISAILIICLSKSVLVSLACESDLCKVIVR
jgi:hypothetical protein